MMKIRLSSVVIVSALILTSACNLNRIPTGPTRTPAPTQAPAALLPRRTPWLRLAPTRRPLRRKPRRLPQRRQRLSRPWRRGRLSPARFRGLPPHLLQTRQQCPRTLPRPARRRSHRDRRDHAHRRRGDHPGRRHGCQVRTGARHRERAQRARHTLSQDRPAPGPAGSPGDGRERGQGLVAGWLRGRCNRRLLGHRKPGPDFAHGYDPVPRHHGEVRARAGRRQYAQRTGAQLHGDWRCQGRADGPGDGAERRPQVVARDVSRWVDRRLLGVGRLAADPSDSRAEQVEPAGESGLPPEFLVYRSPPQPTDCGGGGFSEWLRASDTRLCNRLSRRHEATAACDGAMRWHNALFRQSRRRLLEVVKIRTRAPARAVCVAHQ